MSRTKKSLTPEAAAQKYKNDYENNLRKLKVECEAYIATLDDAKLTEDEKKQKKSSAEYTAIAIMEAEKLWMVIRVAMTNSSFAQKKDEEKIELVRKDFAEFYKSFPVVSRCMACAGEYRQKAFRRFLKLCDAKLSKQPEKHEEDYMQNQWL